MRRFNIAESAAKSVLSSPSVMPYYIFIARAGLALMAVQRGDVAASREQYTALDPVRGIMFAYVGTDRVLGLLSLTMGRLDQAVVHFEDALTTCRKAGYRPELAWTCYDYAEALLHPSTGSGRVAPGDHARAMSLLDEAFAITHELGMRPLMERVAALRERAESQPAKAPAYPDGLTQREVEVLRLIAAGQSNPEVAEELFISINTVTRHLTNIFAKTGTANRAEAAVYAARHNLL